MDLKWLSSAGIKRGWEIPELWKFLVRWEKTIELFLVDFPAMFLSGQITYGGNTTLFISQPPSRILMVDFSQMSIQFFHILPPNHRHLKFRSTTETNSDSPYHHSILCSASIFLGFQSKTPTSSLVKFPYFPHLLDLQPCLSPKTSGSLEDVPLQQRRGGAIVALTAPVLTGPQQELGPFKGAQP